jgi:adenine-specific DNA-methyltransferase
LRKLGEINDEGIVLTTNTKASGRFHSIWLSSILPRLVIARSLLTDDGVIFISIDDREIHHLRTLLNELFGDENFLASFVWVNEGNIDNQSKIKTNHEYILAYAKNAEKFIAPPVIDPNIPLTSKLYKDAIENTIVKNGPKNPVSDVTLPVGFPASFKEGVVEPKKDFWPRLNKKVTVKDFKTQNEVIVSSGWSSKDIFEQFINSGFKPVVDTKGQQATFYLTDTGAIYNRKDRPDSQSHVLTILKGMGTVQATASALAESGIFFDYPKPTELISYLLKVGNSKDSIVMDFYAGTCPLAQATYELNQEDNGNRKYICIQIPEATEADSSARKAGFKTISEIGKKRIRSVIKKLKAEKKGKLNLDPNEDLGFKVYSLDRSNFRDWELYEGKDSAKLETLFDRFETPLIEGWKSENLLTETLLLQGFPLDSSVTSLPEFKGNDVKQVTSKFVGHHLYVCLDKKVKAETVAKLSLRAEDILVCLDSALSDEAKVNLADRCNLKVI